MFQNPDAIERKLQQTRRLARLAGDTTTVQRLSEFAEELKQKLHLVWSRTSSSTEDTIRNRARELWEQHGRPEGRDVEFWLRAEREILEVGAGRM